MQNGQVIYSEADSCAGLYIVMHGRVKLYYESIDGKEQIVDIIGPGSIFGDVSLSSTDSNYGVSAKAYEDGVYCGIPLNYYHKLLKEKPQVALRLLSVLESQLTKSRKTIRDLSLKRARHRMASIIARMAQEDGQQITQGVEIKLPMTVQTLAFMSGLTQETASRVLSEFRKEKIVSLKSRRLCILDYELLVETAQMG